jgi:hypothetical protein
MPHGYNMWSMTILEVIDRLEAHRSVRIAFREAVKAGRWAR